MKIAASTMEKASQVPGALSSRHRMPQLLGRLHDVSRQTRNLLSTMDWRQHRGHSVMPPRGEQPAPAMGSFLVRANRTRTNRMPDMRACPCDVSILTRWKQGIE